MTATMGAFKEDVHKELSIHYDRTESDNRIEVSNSNGWLKTTCHTP